MVSLTNLTTSISVNVFVTLSSCKTSVSNCYFISVTCVNFIGSWRMTFNTSNAWSVASILRSSYASQFWNRPVSVASYLMSYSVNLSLSSCSNCLIDVVVLTIWSNYMDSSSYILSYIFRTTWQVSSLVINSVSEVDVQSSVAIKGSWEGVSAIELVAFTFKSLANSVYISLNVLRINSCSSLTVKSS
ncbi:hypothetical protein FC45_GL000649 [Lactobacillus jensenii DSM 20557]|nr:hypothetical protein FC45_GL000649 [Lactobacillus jensenii DSM 20557]